MLFIAVELNCNKLLEILSKLWYHISCQVGNRTKCDNLIMPGTLLAINCRQYNYAMGIGGNGLINSAKMSILQLIALRESVFHGISILMILRNLFWRMMNNEA